MPATPEPTPFQSRCKVCRHPRLAEINERLLRGESTGEVADWLERCGEGLRRQGLANHRTYHLAVALAARESLAQQHAGAAERIVADVGLLDYLASVGMHFLKQLAALEPASMTMAQVALLGTCMREVRAAVETKHELLNGKRYQVDAKVDGLAGLMGLVHRMSAEKKARAAAADERPPGLPPAESQTGASAH
jgi:hypothetical protein